MTNFDAINEWLRRAGVAKYEAHRILATHEGSTTSRIILLEDLMKALSGLPVDVEDYFKESIICLESNLLRAAVVLSWSGFFHVLAEKLFNDHEAALRSSRAKWKFSNLTELKENYSEFAILEACKEVKLINKAKLREYQGQLSKRNQCAHPTLFKPSPNSAIGFVDEMLRQAKTYL